MSYFTMAMHCMVAILSYFTIMSVLDKKVFLTKVFLTKVLFDKSLFDKSLFDKSLFDKSLFDKSPCNKGLFDIKVLRGKVFFIEQYFS
jgi:hypothetical protein